MNVLDREELYESLRGDLEIDVFDLTRVCSKHPGLFLQVYNLITDVETEIDMVENAIEELRAALAVSLFSDPGDFGIEEMPSTVKERRDLREGVVESDPDISALKTRLKDLNNELKRYQGLYQAYKHRRDMLPIIQRRESDQVFSDRINVSTSKGRRR